MPQICSTNYVCTPIWYTNADSTEGGGDDVVVLASGGYVTDLNVTYEPNTGTVQFQVKDSNDNWVTPAEPSYTVSEFNLVRLPRANMPDIRVYATADATFYIEGAL